MTPERVLGEMRSAGLAATELGPPGFLPDDPAERRALLDRHGIRPVAGFIASVLHATGAHPLAQVEEEAVALQSAGAEVLVLAAAMPGESYDSHDQLSASEWRLLRDRIAAAQDIAAAHRLRLAFHPHAGTAVETRDQVEALLATTEVDLCLDTGHLVLGGTDPVRLLAQAGGRIGHVHLKDVAAEAAARVRSGELSYRDAVRAGLYTPLGRGSLDIEAIVTRLVESGYRGWYVLEQDTALTAEPEPASGPVVAARHSLDYFEGVSQRQAGHQSNWRREK
jgi:inosose dehydratase